LLPAALCVALAVPASGPALTLPAAGPGVAAVPAASSSTVTADLQRKLTAALNQSAAGGIAAAVDFEGLGQVYRRWATSSVAPASTQKLFTTFAALKVLTPGGKYVTQVRAAKPRVGNRQPGNLYLVGGGDPSLTGTDLDHLAADVAASGIRTVTGQLLVDDYRYDQVHQGPGWKADFVPGDCGPLSALAVDHNGWRTDKAYVVDPSMGNLERFRSLLARRGVTVSSRIGRAHLPGGTRQVVSHASPTVSVIVRAIDKNSDNFMAELVLKEIGRNRRHVGSTAAGVAAVKDVLAPLGVTVGTLADGSGLSNRNRQSAVGELSLLAAAERTDLYGEFLLALPVACKDGTLKKRMCGTAAAGRARAKTGSLDHVRTLSGWTTTADGYLVRFAFLLSRDQDATKARQALDNATAILSAARVAG
jgi:D-alanyl-D-alanine carboxypeptidase/D-alanyl-D-alanine-endopeptidase (penicillin-binding protein 4)